MVSGEIDFDSLREAPVEKIDAVCQEFLAKSLGKLRTNHERQQKRPPFSNGSRPLIYLIVATGNIHEDIWQAQAAAEMGADIIAVIRSTAQSLLDYVPEGETTEGFGGTFATQANFRLMRQALDQMEKKLKRRIGLTNYSSGLCMPEIALLGAFEGIDFLLNDAMYGILFRDINMKRNFIDQNFSRRICALSGITIQTGEDNYLTTAESHKYWFQVLASHFINQAFAKRAGLPDTSIALGHAHEVDPAIEDSLLTEWAQAQLVREVFPNSPIKYMPPTKYKSGDIFFGYLYDGMFNLASVLTGQSIHLLGMHTEAIYNPYVQDRFLSLKNADYVFRAGKSLKEEIVFQPNGKIVRRARQVLEDGLRLLRRIKVRGLMKAIEEGNFAHVRRHPDGGKGLDGVIE
ncbi:MAG: lysine 5,6-aminomutase subunit alpha TIM-barrel domain-containing protein, partial [Candidatus Binatia bacterium]